MNKYFLLVLTLLSLNSFAIDRNQVNRLLQQRQMTLSQFEQNGSKLVLGEVTGAGLVLPAERVQVLILNDRVVLKREIESMDFAPITGKLSDLDSFRAGGLYFTRQDIKAVIHQ
ncbi:MAG: hypothetical protein K2P81_07975 [Bacteriovoracaceae bacterium]|nr:hypothetical protein [Bacteriovoracaceae bacterium]